MAEFASPQGGRRGLLALLGLVVTLTAPLWLIVVAIGTGLMFVLIVVVDSIKQLRPLALSLFRRFQLVGEWAYMRLGAPKEFKGYYYERRCVALRKSAAKSWRTSKERETLLLNVSKLEQKLTEIEKARKS